MATDMALEDVLPMLAVVHEAREVQTILETNIPGVWSLDLGAGACLHCFRAWGDSFPKPANRSASWYCCLKLGNKIGFPVPLPTDRTNANCNADRDRDREHQSQ